MKRQEGFSLVEIAVCLLVIGLLLGQLMHAMAPAAERRAQAETRRAIAESRELLMGYLIANGRLPCPALETPMEKTGPGGECLAPQKEGLVPAFDIAMRSGNDDGFALDAWGQKLRYAVADRCKPGPAAVLPPLTSAAAVTENKFVCVHDGIAACAVSQADCAVNRIEGIAFVVWSVGPDARFRAPSQRETTNLQVPGLFIAATPDPQGAQLGAFSHVVEWVTSGEVVLALTKAGRI